MKSPINRVSLHNFTLYGFESWHWECYVSDVNHVFAILALCALSLTAWGADVPAPPKPADSNATAPAKEKTDAEKKAEAEAKAEEEARKVAEEEKALAKAEDALAKAEAEKKKAKEEAIAKIEREYQSRLAAAAEKWKAATNSLGDFHEIAGRNPFGLEKEVIKKPEYEEPPPEAIVVGKPVLAGISIMRGKVRALLRISPQAGGKSKYEFLEAEEMLEGVEVLNINPVEGIVTVKMLGSGRTPDRTVALNLKEQKSKLPSTGASSRRTSSRWGSRTSSRSSSSRGSSSSSGTGWKIIKPGQETKDNNKGTTPASATEKTKEEPKPVEEKKKPSTLSRPDGLTNVPTRPRSN